MVKFKKTLAPGTLTAMKTLKGKSATFTYKFTTESGFFTEIAILAPSGWNRNTLAVSLQETIKSVKWDSKTGTCELIKAEETVV